MKKLAPMASQPLLSPKPRDKKPMGLKLKLKYHIWTLPRWFALPFFGASILLGVALAGGRFDSIYTWLAFLAGAFIMAGGHAFNSLLDFAWTKLDQGEEADRSAEKDYTGGQNLLAKGQVSTNEVLLNGGVWYILALLVIEAIIFKTGQWWLLAIWAAGCANTVWYSISKFNWTHELALGTAVGPLAVLLGMLAVNPHPNIGAGILVSLPVAVVLSFLGLALDEWPDAEANLKKGVKSIAFMVWKYSEGKVEGLWWYSSTWLASPFCLSGLPDQLWVSEADNRLCLHRHGRNDSHASLSQS